MHENKRIGALDYAQHTHKRLFERLMRRRSAQALPYRRAVVPALCRRS